MTLGVVATGVDSQSRSDNSDPAKPPYSFFSFGIDNKEQSTTDYCIPILDVGQHVSRLLYVRRLVSTNVSNKDFDYGPV